MPTSAPSSGLPFITSPGAASSRSRPSNGSNSARAAPPLRRASDQVQPDVLGLRQELQQRQQRVDGRATGGDEVVVVDDTNTSGPLHQLRSRSSRGPTVGPGSRPRSDAAMSWAASAAASAVLA